LRVLYTAMMLVLYPIARSGVRTLLINRDFNINLLMTIAAVGAALIGEYLEGAAVIFLFALGEALEGFTAERARDSLRSLMALAPNQAVRLVYGTLEETVPVEQLQIGDIILVKSGERIAMTAW
jgi:Cd2+/Zn2+-exporting ATPase